MFSTELLAVAVQKVGNNRYKAVLINEEQLEKIHSGEAQSLAAFPDAIELKDLPSTNKNTQMPNARIGIRINRRAVSLFNGS